MRKDAIIESVGETRTGARPDGTQWAITPVTLSWSDQRSNGAPLVHRLIADVSGNINREKVGEVFGKIPVNVAIYFDVREYEGKQYNSIKAYLPDHYMNK